MNILDLMGLLGELLAKAQHVMGGGSLPFKWSKKKGKGRYIVEGSIRWEKIP